jgi:hypothetical protein
LPEAATIQSAHAHRFAALARRLERPPVWPDNDFLALLDRDQDNLRAALDWLQDREPGKEGPADGGEAHCVLVDSWSLQ